MRISDWSSDVCSSDLVDRTAGQIGDGIEVEVVGPEARERDHRQADAPPGIRGGLAVEIVDQHQRARGDGEADDVGGRDQSLVDDGLALEARQYAGHNDLNSDPSHHGKINALYRNRKSDVWG